MSENKDDMGSALADGLADANDTVDVDDIPELDEAFFARAEFKVGGMPVKRGVGRPAPNGAKQQVTLRLDPMAIEDWRATGPGWQARVNALLWLSSDVQIDPGGDSHDIFDGRSTEQKAAAEAAAERKRDVRAARVSRALASLAGQMEMGRVSKAEAERVLRLIEELRGLNLRELDLLSDVINEAAAD